MPKWNGGVIGVANNPTQSSAKGIWSLSEATKAIRAGLWPPSNAGADPYFENVTLLLPGDGTNGAQNNTFLDSSTNNFTITRNGNTTQGTFTPFSKVDGRWSNFFDGTGDALTFPSSSNLGFGTSNFCIEFWFNAAGVTQPATQRIVGNNSTFGSNAWTIGVSSNNLFVQIYNFTTTNATISTSTNVITPQWNHIVLCRSGSDFGLFVNGTRVGTYSTSASLDGGGSQSFCVGGRTTSEVIGGYISNFRTVIGSSVYTPTSSTLTVPIEPLTAITNTQILTCQSNRFIDNSTNAFAITQNGDVAVTTFSPFPTLTAYAAGTNGGSGYFDGSGDYLSIASNAAFGVGSGDFTIECWIYLTQNFDATGQGIVTASYNTNFAVIGVNSGAGNKIDFYVVNTILTTGTNYIGLNVWTHLAFVRSSGTTRIYFNGVQVASSGSLTGTGAASALTVATSSHDLNQEMTGYISNVRLVKGTAVYTAAFTPPTAPLTAITNTSLLTSFTNGGIIDTSMSNDLETVGNAQISTTQSKFGGASMSFDGTNDYLIMRDTQNLVLGSGDFTIEFWVYYNSGLTSDVALFDGRPASTNGVYPLIYSNTTGKVVWYISSAARITATTTLSTGTWYHIAVARSGTSTKMFINGTQEGSTYTDSNSYLLGANRPTIGAAGATLGADPLNGYIDDLRITKGYARYTANFTPPTGPFVGFGD